MTTRAQKSSLSRQKEFIQCVKRSRISWTDYSGGAANFVLRGKARGDCEGSPGCANCYAWTLRNRNQKVADHTTYDVEKLRRLARMSVDPKGIPFRRGPGARPMCVIADMGDLFHDNIPDEFIHDALAVLASRTDVDWQILTKRAERMADLLISKTVPANIWLGVTAENQAAADERLPFLREVHAAVRFVSVEPMLAPVWLDLRGVSWVICGGETGSQRRRFDKRWAVYLRDQCRSLGVPFFFKQGSADEPGGDDLLNGKRIKEWPAVSHLRHAPSD